MYEGIVGVLTSYLGLTIIFSLSALLIEWEAAHQFLWKKRRLVGAFLIVILSFLFIYGITIDIIAVKQGIWNYGPNKTTGIKIGIIPIDDLFFNILLCYPLVLATIIFARMEERKRKNLPKQFLKDLGKGVKDSEKELETEFKLAEKMINTKKDKKKRDNHL